MTIHRMRTVQEALAEIRLVDAETAVTANCIRTLCKDKQVGCVYSRSKILVDLDNLLAFINGSDDNSLPNVKNE